MSDEHNELNRARMRKTFNETVEKIGVSREALLKEMTKQRDELLAVLKLVRKGMLKGHIKDQSIIDTSDDGPSAKVRPLSSIINDAIAKVEVL